VSDRADMRALLRGLGYRVGTPDQLAAATAEAFGVGVNQGAVLADVGDGGQGDNVHQAADRRGRGRGRPA
jgi:hypothetical protein